MLFPSETSSRVATSNVPPPTAAVVARPPRLSAGAPAAVQDSASMKSAPASRMRRPSPRPNSR
jgi:hypothetical protein